MRTDLPTQSKVRRPDYMTIEVPAEFAKQQAMYIYGFQQGWFGDSAKRRTEFNALESNKAFNAGFEVGANLRRNGRED